MINTANQQIQNEATRALTAENALTTADAKLVTSVTAERERATSIEASLATTTLLIKIDSSNAVMQANNKVLEATNYVSAAMAQNKIDNSNAIFQITATLNNSQSTAIIAVDGKFGFLLAPCPNNSFGVGVATGCTCQAGFSGNVIPTIISPYYSSTCSPVPCPTNTTGINVVLGCACSYAVISGILAATTVAPYYLNICGAYLLEFKAIGPFTWTASFTGMLSVIVVGAGGAGGNIKFKN